MPTLFLELLGRDSLLKVELGDSVERELAVLFSDIRAFTSMAEDMTPKDSFAFLNSYLSGVGPVIREHRGFIDKDIGDAVMALFPTDRADAMHAAVALQRFVQEFNVVRGDSGLGPIAVGVGLHAGTVTLGTIGETARLEGTVISDAVNIGSRLEHLTKELGADILVSGAMIDDISNPNRFAHRFLDRARPRGRKDDVALYQVFEHEPDAAHALKNKTRERLEAAGQASIDPRWLHAMQGFEAVLGEAPNDRAAQRHLERAKAHVVSVCELPYSMP